MKNRGRSVRTPLSRVYAPGLFLLLAGLIFLSGCETTTITEQPGNYVYSQNEPIRVLDIDTRDALLELTFRGVTILRDEPFTLREETGHDESGETLYADVPYEALLRIEYDCEILSRKQSKLSSSNFDVYDSRGDRAARDPEIQYPEGPSTASKSFVVALKHKGDFVDIRFNQKSLQIRPTALIRLEIGASISPADSSEPESEPSSSLSPAPEENTDPSSFFTNRVGFLLGVIAFQFFIIFILVIALIAVATRKRRR